MSTDNYRYFGVVLDMIKSKKISMSVHQMYIHGGARQASDMHCADLIGREERLSRRRSLE